MASELVDNSQKLWAQVLAGFYLRGKSIFDPLQRKGSTTWNNILKASKQLADGFFYKIGDGSTSFWYTPWLYKEPLSSLVPFVDIHDVELRICDVWVNGSWQLDALYTRLPNEVINKLQQINPRLVNGLVDTWVWGECSSGTYSVRSVYHMFINIENPQQDHQLHWAWLWKLKLPSNIQFFLWELCHHAIPTRAVLHARGISASDTCPRCDRDLETMLHCFFDCPQVRPVWQNLGLGGYASPTNTDKGTLLQWVRDAAITQAAIIPSVLWSLWIARNKLVFDKEKPPPHVLCSRVVSLIHSINRAFAWIPADQPPAHTPREVAWKGSPDDNTVALNVDGSCLGNPGRASFGGLLRDHSGAFIFGFFGAAGHTTILQAELLGLLHGLQCCWERGFRRVVCYSDSLQVIQLVQEGVQPRHHFSNEVHAIRGLIAREWECQIFHTLREGNQCADFFAKKGVASTMKFCMVMQAPHELALSLLADASGVLFPRP